MPESTVYILGAGCSKDCGYPLGPKSFLTAAEMKRCRWVKPAIVCQIKFTEWTRDDRRRQPVFLGIRKDKNASEVVREQDSAAIF